MRLQRHIGGLAVALSAHLRCERGVHRRLQIGDAAEAGGQLDRRRRARRHELALDLLVERNVGAPEPVDRLLRVADEEELAGQYRHLPPVLLLGIIGREQEENLSLQGVGVLELVDEVVRVTLLQLAAHGCVFAHQVAGAQEQVEEIELAEALLDLFVRLDDRPQLVVQQRREIRIATAYVFVERRLHSVASRDHVFARQVIRVGPARRSAPPPMDETRIGDVA